MKKLQIAKCYQDVFSLMNVVFFQIIVVSLRPQLKVLFSHLLKASASTLPLLAWQFVVIQMPDGTRVVDPVLAFGREKNVYFYQVNYLEYLLPKGITNPVMIIVSFKYHIVFAFKKIPIRIDGFNSDFRSSFGFYFMHYEWG